ncbi:hypothetical protein HDU85_002571 [Gaertneriomyces sp. JEL0708]|nr:hypothetical protein HDU85_002571 [Gaertneriomyces sp. JEL0708]
MPSALVLVAPGSEEMETVITVDILRRANINVTLAGLTSGDPVECSRGIKLIPDKALHDISNKTGFDALVLPGGLKGAESFSKSQDVHKLLHEYYSNPQKYVAIICASPIALHAAGVATGKKITSHPSVKDQLVKDYNYQEGDQNRVVVDDTLITSRGPGTAFEFALTIVDKLCGAQKVGETIAPMVCDAAVSKKFGVA